MRRLIFLLLAGFVLMSASNPNSEGIEFFKGSFTSAKLKASEEGRLFFLDFTASWCTPCRWMEETTFTDPTLAAYVKDNYVALQVDIDDFDGFALKQEYNIQILPSLLIFNSKGELLGQYEESLSPSRMLEILKQYDQPHNRIATNTSRPNYVTSQPVTESKMELPSTFMVNTATDESAPVIDYTSNRPPAVGSIGNITRNRLVKKEEVVEFTYEEENDEVTYQEEVIEVTPQKISKPTLHNMPATFTPSNPVVRNNYEAATITTNEKPLAHLPLVDPLLDNGEGLYRFQVARQRSSGYSVQVGAYSEYGNVLKQASMMQQHFEEPVIVHISKNRNRTLYKLMLGEFDTRTAAIDFMRTAQAKGVDCMIKDLSNH